MRYFRSLILLSILYFFSLIGIFAISNVENKIALIFFVTLYVELIVLIVFYYIKSYTLIRRLAITLSLSFLIYMIHLLTTLPFSLIFMSNNIAYAWVQKSVLTSIRILITLQLYVLIIVFLQEVLKREKVKILKVFFAFFFILIISFVIPVNYFQVKLTYLLNSFLPMFFIFYILTHLLLLNKKMYIHNEIIPYLNASLYLIALWAISGYFYGLIFYFDHWKMFDISTFYSLKGYEPINGLPRSWWVPIGNNLFFRFPSTFENPISSGYFSAFFSMMMISLRRYAWGILFFTMTLFSFSKGAIIFLLLYIIVFLSYNKSFLLRMFISKALNSPILMLLLLIFYIFLQFVVSEIFKTSAFIHLLGLTSPFVHMNEYTFSELLIGHGIGSGGNFYKGAIGSDLDFTTWLKKGSESGIGTIFYQLGALGLIMFFLIVYKIIFLLRSIEARFIFFFYITSMFLQENLINFNLLILVFFSIIIIEFNQAKKRNTYACDR